jgi:hypothetical protein
MSVIQRVGPETAVAFPEDAEKALALLRQCTSGVEGAWGRWRQGTRWRWPAFHVVCLAFCVWIYLTTFIPKTPQDHSASEPLTSWIRGGLMVVAWTFAWQVIHSLYRVLVPDLLLSHRQLVERRMHLKRVITACSRLTELGRLNEVVKLELELALGEAEIVWQGTELAEKEKSWMLWYQ